jgi:citrate synthase
MRGDRIIVRDRDLAEELIGKLSFTEMLLLDLTGTEANASQVRLVDAILVAMMEHGITPSTLAARVVLDGAPESLQGAVAAGLLATGSRFLGVIEEVGLLVRAVAADEAKGGLEESARRQVERLLAGGQAVPGLGHNLHGSEDPRVPALLGLAESEGVAAEHVAALAAVHRAANALLAQRLIVNAAGAIGAILSDLGYPANQLRGFALVARCAGLFAHVVDERRRPLARSVWVTLNEPAGD